MGIASKAYTFLRHPQEAHAMVTYKIWRDPVSTLESNKESGIERPEMKRCYEFLDLTSRSFAAVIRELQGDLVRAIALFYLILRGLDTVEDDMSIPVEKKVPLLKAFYTKLQEPGWTFTESGPNEKDRQLLVEFDVVIAEFQLLDKRYQEVISRICRDMGEGMARYALLFAESGGKFSVDTWASFDVYCHFVAGLVGEGLSGLFSASGIDNALLEKFPTLSNSLGLFLQKTNILRDFREDCDDGRVFWPRECWGKYVSVPSDLTLAENQDKALAALSEMAADALTHAVDALDYLKLLKNQSVFNFVAIPQVMAIATLDECYGNYNVFHRNVKIRKGRAVELILKATNPRACATVFREEIHRILAKSSPKDPGFLKISIIAGHIDQWIEFNYPSFVSVSRAGDLASDERLKQLAPTLVTKPGQRSKPGAPVTHTPPLTKDDINFAVCLAATLISFIFLMCGLMFGVVYVLFLRPNAPYKNALEGSPYTNDVDQLEKFVLGVKAKFWPSHDEL